MVRKKKGVETVETKQSDLRPWGQDTVVLSPFSGVIEIEPVEFNIAGRPKVWKAFVPLVIQKIIVREPGKAS